jgi:hypothetical protein
LGNDLTDDQVKMMEEQLKVIGANILYDVVPNVD